MTLKTYIKLKSWRYYVCYIIMLCFCVLGSILKSKIIIQKNEDNISNHEIENSTPISTKIHWFGLGVLLVSTIINLIGLSIELDSCTGLGCGWVSIFYLIVFWMISIIILVIAAIIKRKSKTWKDGTGFAKETPLNLIYTVKQRVYAQTLWFTLR